MSPHPVDVHVGKQLRLRRTLRGLAQKELARLLDVSFQQLQKYESAANRVSASKLWQACQALDVQPNYFFDGLGKRKSSVMPRMPTRATLLMMRGFSELPGDVQISLSRLVKVLLARDRLN